MPTRVQIKFALLGWVGATIVFSALLALSDLGAHQKPLAFILYANALHFALWALALPLLSKCTRALPLSRERRVQNSIVLLFLVAALGFLVTVVQWAILFSTYFPYRSPGATFKSFLAAELVRFLPNDVLIGIVLVIAIELWRVFSDFQAERIRNTDLERQLAVARLDALRMQLQPHFLFNTLHTITSLIMEQPLAARRMVIELGDLLRFTLKDTGDSVHSLAKELEFADLYLGIEKHRLGDRLILDYDIEPEATAACLPQLLLQPLFENAVRHGAARILDSCEIRFCAGRMGDRLNLTLLNDGPPHPVPLTPPAFGIGLTNTIARLHLHYQNNFTFEYSPRPEGGVAILLSIPYTKTGEAKAGSLEVAFDNHARVDR